MSGMIHTRNDSWGETLPFASIEDIAAFAGELEKIVTEAIPEPALEVHTQVTYEHGKTGWLSPEEFLDTVPTLAPLVEVDTIFVTTAYADEEEAAAQADDSEFGASLLLQRGKYPSTRLKVEGRKLTMVEGVRTTAKAAIEQHVEKRRQVEAEAKRQAEADEERKRRAEQVVVPARTKTIQHETSGHDKSPAELRGEDFRSMPPLSKVRAVRPSPLARSLFAHRDAAEMRPG